MALELNDIALNVGADSHLSGISVQFHAGSFNVLLGQTLAGKTSLMRIMAGLDKPTSGTITMNGIDVTGVPVQKRNVAFVYQQFINYPSMTVYANIASPLKLQGFKRHEIEARVIKIASLLGIAGMLDR